MLLFFSDHILEPIYFPVNKHVVCLAWMGALICAFTMGPPYEATLSLYILDSFF